MLIDDLKELGLSLNKAKMRDAVVFRVNESIESFGENHLSKTDPRGVRLPSLLPYDNMVIHYDGSLVWLLSEATDNEIVILSSFFRPGSIQALKHSMQPSLAVVAVVDSETYAHIGSNIYYPNERRNEFLKNQSRSQNTLLSSHTIDEINQLIANDFGGIQAFLSILSCKNIKTELETPDEKIQKKRAAKGKLPLVSFYTLKIQNIRHSHEATQSGLWSNRVHFCRGHMREYTADAPLFGKITGRFWVGPHVRGDKAKGIIVKDYEVNTSKGVTK